MAVRRQCNRYRTSPYGADFNDVKKRAKAFFRDGTFYIVGNEGGLYFSERPSLPPFRNPDGAIYFTKFDGKWVESKRNA